MRPMRAAIVRLAAAIAVAVGVGALAATPSAAGQPAPGAAQPAAPFVAAPSGAAQIAAPSGAAPSAAAPSALAAGEQWRGYWVDAFNRGVFTAAQVDTLISDAQQARANALIVQVGRRFDCFCNDALLPRTEAAISALPYDPLRTVVERAHAAGLEVHAWVNATTLWNSATAPRAPDHAYNTHGPSASGADRWLNKRIDGVEIVSNNSYLDPANPAAVDYLVDAIASITSNYDVDGVNLDYIRYPDYSSGSANDWGYSQTSLARFRAETGRSDTPSASDGEFSQWRRDQVTALVRKVYLRMYEIDRSDRLSVNGITYGYGPATYGWEGTAPYKSVLQDWRAWTQEGVVDTVVTMNYKRQYLSDQARMFAEWTDATVNYQGNRQNVVGPALYLNELDDNVAQARAVADSGAAGWSGYSYANVSATATGSSNASVKDSERDRLEAALTSEVFTGPASVPEMGWKTAPTTGHLAGTLLDADGRPLDQVDVQVRQEDSSAGVSRTARTDGAGWFGVLDLGPGRYVVEVAEPGIEACEVGAGVGAGSVAEVTLRSDAGPCAPEQVFADVPPGAPFYDDIAWLHSEGITTGSPQPDGLVLFEPSQPVRREAMAAFLYRYRGSPEFTPSSNSPFIDVGPTDAFYKEIAWLADQGIATGSDIGEGLFEFRPADPVAREAMAAFLYRTHGEPAFSAPATSPFVDVPTTHPFYTEIAWLAEEAISTGTPLGGDRYEFRPTEPVSREAMAAFLHRASVLR